MSSPPTFYFDSVDTKRPLKILCVGTSSVSWFLENTANYVECVVPPPEITADLASSPVTGKYERYNHRLMMHRGYPHIVLRSFDFGTERFRTFDIVYVDDPQLKTLMLAFDFLKTGGLMIISGNPTYFEAFVSSNSVDVARRDRNHAVVIRVDS